MCGAMAASSPNPPRRCSPAPAIWWRPLPDSRHAAGPGHPVPDLYEDADLLVLDKPAGLVVHPAPATRTARWSTRCSPIAATACPVSVAKAAGHRPPTRQGHLRRHGRGQNRAGVGHPVRRLRRPRPRPRLFGPVLGPAQPGRRRDRGRHRARSARPQAHGHGGTRRQACFDPLPVARAARGRRIVVGMSAGHGAHTSDPRTSRGQGSSNRGRPCLSASYPGGRAWAAGGAAPLTA